MYRKVRATQRRMKINEIFDSIDGEGLRTGELATFIRLAGCNLRCRYCDTSYALSGKDGAEMSIEQIIEKVKAFKNKNITLTGGEPLIHERTSDLIRGLSDFNINIETNGSIDIEPYTSFPNVLITMDYKTSSSGERDKMLLSNIKKLRESDVLKIVMSSKDKQEVFDLLNDNEIKSYVYLSPIYGECDPKELVDFLKHLRASGIDVSKTRVQVQLHKIIWEPDERGV